MAANDPAALQALQEQIAQTVQLGPKAVPAAIEPSPRQKGNSNFREQTKDKGGQVTSVIFTPAAKAILDAAKEGGFAGLGSQSAYASAAVVAFAHQAGGPAAPVLDLKALQALADIRYEFPEMASDDEAISFAARWFIRFVREEGIESIDLGDDE